MKTAAYFAYTVDNENLAIDQIETDLKNMKLKVVSVTVEYAERACRNAYGKELDEDEFDAIDPDSDEAWFDDYDFIIKAIIEHDDSREDLLAYISDNSSEYLDEYADDKIDEYIYGNLSNFDLDGVEIVDEDIETIKNHLGDGLSFEQACNKVLLNMRDCLDSDLNDDEED